MQHRLIMIGIVFLGVTALRVQAQEVAPEERTAIRDVQLHLQQKQFEQAEQELHRRLEEFPDSARLHALHMNFAYAYRRTEQHASAFAHMEKLVDFYLSAATERPAYYKQMANALDALSGYGHVADETEKVQSQFDTILTTLQQRLSEAEPDPDDRVLGALHDVRLRLINFLITLQQYEEADKHLTEELHQAKQEYQEKSDSPEFVLRLSNALQSRVTLRDVTGADDLEDARYRQLVFLQLKAEEFSDDAEILSAYLDAHMQAIRVLSRSEPDQAEELLNKSKLFIEGIDSEERVISQKVMIAQRSLPYLQQLIVDGKRHAKLLEKDWTPPQAIAWLNSEPLSQEDLAGKVVLLDFWSVWCIPCLDSFPHLSRWHEKYADDDLVIVGVTRFYNYGWDEKRGQMLKDLDRNVPQSEEQEALSKFARQKNLKYPLAITAPGSDFQQNYHVVSLPQTVLIDREGKIRFIRIGTGPTIARELERKIEELLADDEKTSGSTQPTAADEATVDSSLEKSR